MPKAKKHTDGAKVAASGHMRPYLTDSERRAKINKSIEMIKHSGQEFDVIAYRGASGAITAAIIGHEMRKPLVLVRKPEDKGHSYLKIEGPEDFKRYLIVDDFMSSGATYEAIRQALRDHCPAAECIGMMEVSYSLGNAYKMQEGPYVFRFSAEHVEEIHREQRIVRGEGTSEDIAWLITESTRLLTIKHKRDTERLEDATSSFNLRKRSQERQAARAAQRKAAKSPKPEVKVEYVYTPTPPVLIYNDGAKYKFDFENNTQKLLTNGESGEAGGGLGALFIRQMVEFGQRLSRNP
jgi:orotate phosphoribosyltransferase